MDRASHKNLAMILGMRPAEYKEMATLVRCAIMLELIVFKTEMESGSPLHLPQDLSTRGRQKYSTPKTGGPKRQRFRPSILTCLETYHEQKESTTASQHPSPDRSSPKSQMAFQVRV